MPVKYPCSDHLARNKYDLSLFVPYHGLIYKMSNTVEILFLVFSHFLLATVRLRLSYWYQLHFPDFFRTLVNITISWPLSKFTDFSWLFKIFIFFSWPVGTLFVIDLNIQDQICSIYFAIYIVMLLSDSVMWRQSLLGGLRKWLSIYVTWTSSLFRYTTKQYW